MKKLLNMIGSFKPPIVISCIAALLLCTAATFIVFSGFDELLYPVVVNIVYIGAALALAMAVWSVVLFCKSGSPKKRFAELARRGRITGKLLDDYSFRTVTFAYGSLALNVIMTLAKGASGWISGSWWPITFSAYYMILCIARFVLIKSSRKLARLENADEREKQEWKAYRVCGGLLLTMTVVLFGVVVLIVKDGNRFTYYGFLIFAVALWDFYCLTTAIIYMIRNRKRHSPIIVAIKTIGFASALVSILSLQTAMFASFGGGYAFQNMMNLVTGSAVSLTLLATGLIMLIKSTKKLRQYRIINI